MGVRWNKSVRPLAKRLMALVSDFTPELKLAGEVAADQIIITTLQGIGEGDKAFTPYSESYANLLAHVGGKPSGVVDLRGVFQHAGKREKSPKQISKNLISKGGGRKAFIWITLGKKQILFQTAQTRARKGIIDKDSEMSRDLIKVEVSQSRCKLIYTNRLVNYMIRHQRGDSRMPQRKWFSINKVAVKAAAISVLTAAFQARIARFNEG